MSKMFLQLLCIVALTTGALCQHTAVCDMYPDPNLDTDLYLDEVYGIVNFTKEGKWVNVSIDLSGFDTTDENFLHGFHIHQSGDLSFGCASTGGDFNPSGKSHGLRTEVIRHVGDLGNLWEDEYGEVQTMFRDDVISLNGKNSIIGRAAVIHASVDIGSAGDDHGSSGALLACCIITDVLEEAF